MSYLERIKIIVCMYAYASMLGFTTKSGERLPLMFLAVYTAKYSYSGKTPYQQLG